MAQQRKVPLMAARIAAFDGVMPVDRAIHSASYSIAAPAEGRISSRKESIYDGRMMSGLEPD